MPESGEGTSFMNRLGKVRDLLPRLKSEKYVRPTPQQVRDSLVAFRNALDNTGDVDSEIAIRLSKWREHMAYSTAEEKVELADDLYKIAAKRNASLRREAPEIVQRILHEYRPISKHATEIRVEQAPQDLLRDSINQKLLDLAKRTPSP